MSTSVEQRGFSSNVIVLFDKVPNSYLFWGCGLEVLVVLLAVLLLVLLVVLLVLVGLLVVLVEVWPNFIHVSCLGGLLVWVLRRTIGYCLSISFRVGPRLV